MRNNFFFHSGSVYVQMERRAFHLLIIESIAAMVHNFKFIYSMNIYKMESIATGKNV